VANMPPGAKRSVYSNGSFGSI